MMKIVFRHCAWPRDSSARNSAQFSEPHPSPPQTSACGCCRCSRACTTRSARSSASAAPTSSPSSPRCARSAPTTWSCCSALTKFSAERKARRGSVRRVADALHRGRRVELHGERRRRGQPCVRLNTAERLTRTAPQLTEATSRSSSRAPIQVQDVRRGHEPGLGRDAQAAGRERLLTRGGRAARRVLQRAAREGAQADGKPRAEARLGLTLFDKDFTLDELKAAAAAEQERQCSASTVRGKLGQPASYPQYTTARVVQSWHVTSHLWGVSLSCGRAQRPS